MADRNEYRIYQDSTVQVLGRFEAAPDCRVCGGTRVQSPGEEHGDEGHPCPGCNGSGREAVCSWAKIGYVTGLHRGYTEEVRATGLGRQVDSDWVRVQREAELEARAGR